MNIAKMKIAELIEEAQELSRKISKEIIWHDDRAKNNLISSSRHCVAVVQSLERANGNAKV